VTPNEKEIVYLVDGSSYVHRAYHAIRNLSNSKGFPTNVIFGFTKMILKLLADATPAYLAVVLDAKGPTFRHEIYEAYKANRPPMPDDMAEQIPITKEILKKLGIRVMEKEGYEADDIIGTLAGAFEKKGFKVVVVSGDKDFRQVITPDTSMWDTMKDSVTDYATLKSAYEFEPERFIDVMSLSGDTSDNIPGVPGVGEKTAVNLIKEFGSLEKVFDQAAGIKKKALRENLLKSRDAALLSRKLVTIDRFVPIETEVEALRIGTPSRKELSEIFRDLEFRDLWTQFTSRHENDSEYIVCLSKETIGMMVTEISEAGLVSVDTETTSQDPLQAELVGISFCCTPGKAYYLPIAHHYEGVPEQIGWEDAREALKEVLENERIRKVGQNLKYDAEILLRHGITLKGIHFDTMIASYVINPGLRQHNLDSLSQHYLNHKMISYHDVVGKGKNECNFSEVDVERATAYSCEDADITLRLWQILDRKLKTEQNEALFYDLEMKLLPVLMDMEMAGIRIDTAFLKRMSFRIADQMKRIESDIFTEAGMAFNLNSPQQLGYILFEKLQLPVQRKTTKTKKYSTDVKVLEKLSALPHKLPQLVLRYRSLSKLKSTYLDALIKMVNPSTGRVHTSYNQTVAATGRLSSSNPNLQNIPIRGEEGREIRRGFVAEAGHCLVSADYSQVELRVFAHYSGDAAFLEAFKRDEDIHTRTASEILGVGKEGVPSEMRRIAKAINFGIIYGMGAQRLKEELGIELKTAKDYIGRYYDRYQGVTRYRNAMIEMARQEGYVTTLFNRRRYLPDIHHTNRVIRGEAERMAINTPIQGTAADLIKMAMINIQQRLKRERFETQMILQVHDELVFEVPEKERTAVISLIKEEMEGVYPLRVPLKVDINEGKNWGEAH